MKDLDLRPILKDWPYQPGKITVRKIVGQDGTEKIQMRVDLGLLQMETTRRPDGSRPHGQESLLHHHLEKLNDYKEKNGTEIGFELDSKQCSQLREEAFMYYQRYLSEFVLEDFEAVVRDTARNLEVLDLCLKCAEHHSDRYTLEQYRPYIVMMNARARCFIAEQNDDLDQAVSIVDEGLNTIRDFFAKYEQPDAFDESQEVEILQALRRELQEKIPLPLTDQLRQELADAVEDERFEDAAELRDQLEKLED